MWKFFFFLLSLPLFGAPIGNTSMPEILHKGFFISSDSWIDFRLGYEGDFVTDGRMAQYEQGSGRVDTYEEWTNAGTFTLNILDRMDLFGVFGSSKAEVHWRYEDPAAETVTRVKLETEESFLWAAGIRSIVYEWCKASIGLGGRYTFSNYKPHALTLDGHDQSVTGSAFHWREWQINLDLSYKIDLFTPYIGVKYLNARTHLTDFPEPISQDLTGSNSFKNRNPIGLYLGCAISSGRYFVLNLEGRLVDEEAITVSSDFRF